jgi:signal transduction histidine kinase
MVAEMPPDLLERPNYQPEHRRLLRQLGIQSALFVPLKIREEVLGSIMFIRADLSRKYTQEDLELAQELARRATQAVENARLYREAQNAIKDREEFLSVAAHELKTPITGLKGFTQILLRRMQKGQAFDPLRTSRDLNAINNQADKLTHLINQLLDISRIELGKLVLEPHYTDLIPLVEGVIAQAQVETTNHSLNLTVPGDPLIVLADPLRFEQVVVNLVNNAIKYSPEGGPVEVELKQASADTICLSVRDWGLGIPPEYRGNIFDRFYQAHQRAHLGGMGLGLYITRQIVELHGGKIEVSFPAEGGTRFVVTLPVRAEPKS